MRDGLLVVVVAFSMFLLCIVRQKKRIKAATVGGRMFGLDKQTNKNPL